jgi:hypothetical protein
LNAYAERFVRTIKESCLDRMILFGEDSLRNAIREFVAHSISNETIKDWAISWSSQANRTRQRREVFKRADGLAER